MGVREVLERQKAELMLRLGQRFVPRRTTLPAAGPLVTVVLGPRRSGKSFLCTHDAAAVGGFGYANFDDELMVDIDKYDELLADIASVYGSPTRLLLDEVQNLERWELLVNRLQRQGYQLVVTGSNAHLLGSELATHLTGRHLPVVLFPFSFSEYLDATDLKGTPAAGLRQYLVAGGFPETLTPGIDAKHYLTALLQSVIYKDVVKRKHVRAPEGIENLARYLLSNCGSEYSHRGLTEVARSSSENTVGRYIAYLHEAFLLFSLSRYSTKVRAQMKANRKVYAVDTGMAGAAGFALSPNTGRLAENVVAIALHRRRLQGAIDLFFWKSAQHEEVDFVVIESQRPSQLIQVCWNLDQPRTLDREVRALLKASAELRCTELLVLTESLDETRTQEWFGTRGTVRFMPLWRWLLDADAPTAGADAQ